ncbi:MAG: PEP-CTERM sorting domain-containing protein [Puniceicoccaceae bacterium]
MKNIFKLAFLVAILSPVIASAQLITLSGPLTADDPSPSGSSFHDLAWAMANDNETLFSTPYDPGWKDNPPTDDKTDLTVTTDFAFDLVNEQWEADLTFDGDHINFVRIANVPFFFLREGGADFAFIGNESSHDNEIYVKAYNSDMSKNEFHTDPLADYDEADPNPTDPVDTAPVSWGIGLGPDITDGVALVQFWHFNLNLPAAEVMANQADTERFTFWAGINEDQSLSGDFLMAISDRDGKADADIDDGIFYFRGDITPVPEPSQIAGLALLGLGAALYIRRRFTKKK